MRMRFWCVPSASEALERSPQLPPRATRAQAGGAAAGAAVRSPSPPPRLSKEEKIARGVVSSSKGRKRKQTDKKRKKARRQRPGSELAVSVGGLASASASLVDYSSLQRKSQPSSSSSTRVHRERSVSLQDLNSHKAERDRRRKERHRSKASDEHLGARPKRDSEALVGSLLPPPEVRRSQPSLPDGAESLIQHPGKSKSREKKKSSSSSARLKKGKNGMENRMHGRRKKPSLVPVFMILVCSRLTLTLPFPSTPLNIASLLPFSSHLISPPLLLL